MASDPVQGLPHLSRRNGCRCVPELGVSVEEVLVAVGEVVGFDHILSASRMNKAIVVFLSTEQLVSQLTENGVWVRGSHVTMTPLATPATKITVSNVPPFIPNDAILKELARYGKTASPVRMIPLGCKNPALKHVFSFRRQVFMFLTSPERVLEISFRVSHGESSYMLYASTNNFKCFECGDLGHKRSLCPHKKVDNDQLLPDGAADTGSSNTNGNRDTTEVPASQHTKVMKRPAERPSEEVKGREEVRESDANVESSEQAGCSSAGVPGKVQKGNNTGTEVQVNAQAVEEDSGDELDGLSQCTDDSMRDDEQWSEGSEGFKVTNFYTVDQINNFLDNTKGKSVEVSEFFSDPDKFVASVIQARNNSSLHELSQQKRYRLKKHVTTIRKRKRLDRGKNRGENLTEHHD